MAKEERKYYKPVRWLFGLQLLGSLKGILLYVAFGAKLDPRDWMTARVFPDQDRRKALAFWQDLCKHEQNENSKDPEAFWTNQEEFWFDYLADASDGTKAMYSVAYLSMCDFWVNAPNDELPPACRRAFSKKEVSGLQKLPRGEFLFIGGDTAYHIADYMTLANRVQQPFAYAYQDLVKNGRIEKNQSPRPLFGIPGNHDYYDQLDGFRRQFRKPIRDEPAPGLTKIPPEFAQLRLAGYRRAQEASYVALRLPFDWWFWGLDTETGPIDGRQKNFFQSLGNETPRKLIVATCSPTTALGKIASKEDKTNFKADGAFEELGIARPYLPDKKSDGSYDLTKSGDAKLNAGQCRLDLSGDFHHYARYWGPKPAHGEKTRAKPKAAAPEAKSYASVISGLGGAFHHPSSTYVDEVQEQVLFPDETTSRKTVAGQVFSFWNIINGGHVWAAGFVIAFMIFFAASVPQSSRQFISNLPWLAGIGLVRAEPSPGSFLSWPANSLIGLGLIILALVSTLAIFYWRDAIFRRAVAPEPEPRPSKLLWPAVIIIGLMALIGFWIIGRYAANITPFGSSLLVLVSLVFAIGAIALSARYNEYLFKRSYSNYIKRRDWFWPWALWIVSVVMVAFGLSSFGSNNLPAHLVSDIVFTLILVGAFAVFLLFPFVIGGELFYNTRPRALATLGKLLIGLWHAILQLAVPFVLIRRGTILTWTVAVIPLVIPIWLAAYLAKKNYRIPLV